MEQNTINVGMSPYALETKDESKTLILPYLIHKNIFISYPFNSNIGYKLRKYFIEEGFNVFDHNSPVKIGENLQSNIDLCTDFILVIEDEKHIADSKVSDEFNYAVKHKKHIIPIATESVEKAIDADDFPLYNISTYLQQTSHLIINEELSDDDYKRLKESLIVTSISKAQAEQIERKKERKKNIDEIVSGLKTDKIEREHSRVQWWYWICIGLFFCLIVGFGFFMYWNVTSINKDSGWEIVLIRVLISMSFLSMIFILMNQAARSRKNLVLLSKEIQEYDYIGALLKGKVDYSTNEEETNKAIDSTFDKMIEQHLTIQKQRLEKEDHTEVKDITPDVLNFFKENTSTMMGNFNEMQKNILDLHKTIVQTLKDDKEKK